MNAEQTIHFIINPISGIGKQAMLPNLIEQTLNGIIDYEIHFTKYAGHAKIIAQYLSKQGEYMIVAVGGDGSVNEVASALVHSNTLLGIIPTGSGNGFANHLNIPKQLEKSIEIIKNGNFELVDIGTFGDHYFVSNCGIGFDAKIAKEFAEEDSRGLWTYTKLCFKHFFDFKSERVQIKIDDEKILVEDAFFISIANTSEFGNRFQIAPENDHKDGLFEVVVFKKPNLFILPFTLLRFFNKSIRKSKYIEHFKGSYAELYPIEMIQKDGDYIDKSFKKLRVSIIPEALKVVSGN